MAEGAGSSFPISTAFAMQAPQDAVYSKSVKLHEGFVCTVQWQNWIKQVYVVSCRCSNFTCIGRNKLKVVLTASMADAYLSNQAMSQVH